MEENMSFWKLLLESNLINFVIFAGIVIWFIKNNLPELVKNKNASLDAELRRAIEKARASEEQLAIAEQELQKTKKHFENLKIENEKKMISFKEELESEKAQMMELMKARYEKDVENFKSTLNRDYERKLVERSLLMAETILKQNKNNYQNYNEINVQQVLSMVEKEESFVRK
jgi:F0F1-type ATP synthase membrane subunit b/b'